MGAASCLHGRLQLFDRLATFGVSLWEMCHGQWWQDWPHPSLIPLLDLLLVPLDQILEDQAIHQTRWNNQHLQDCQHRQHLSKLKDVDWMCILNPSVIFAEGPVLLIHRQLLAVGSVLHFSSVENRWVEKGVSVAVKARKSWNLPERLTEFVLKPSQTTVITFQFKIMIVRAHQNARGLWTVIGNFEAQPGSNLFAKGWTQKMKKTALEIWTFSHRQ